MLLEFGQWMSHIHLYSNAHIQTHYQGKEFKKNNNNNWSCNF